MDKYNRKFIDSNKNTTAFIMYSIEEPYYSYIKLSDCERVITLNFNYNSDRERKKRLKKLDTIIDFLCEFKREFFKDGN